MGIPTEGMMEGWKDICEKSEKIQYIILYKFINLSILNKVER
jgi:hypothetical protein